MSETEPTADDATTARLERERPEPQREYRGAVGRWIELRERLTPAQGTQRLLAVGLGLVGALLALLALLGLAGSGPLG